MPLALIRVCVFFTLTDGLRYASILSNILRGCQSGTTICGLLDRKLSDVVHWGTPPYSGIPPYTAEPPPLHYGTPPPYTASPPPLHHGINPPYTAVSPPPLHRGIPPPFEHTFTLALLGRTSVCASCHKACLVLYTVVLFTSLYIARIVLISLGRTSEIGSCRKANQVPYVVLGLNQ